MKDTFIDKDGDGLNDNRCNGMGIRDAKKEIEIAGERGN